MKVKPYPFYPPEVPISPEYPEVSKVPSLYNMRMPNKNVEYSIILAYVKKYTLKARGGNIQVSYGQGQSGLTYVLLADGISWNEDLIKAERIEIYAQSPSDNVVLEVIVWQ